MADKVVEFPKAKDESTLEVSVISCGACDSIAWLIVVPSPDLQRGERCGQMICKGCGAEFGEWVETLDQIHME